MIIYRQSAASPWIKQGDRLTKTFSSGLCLIQQTYIAPKCLATYDAFEEGDAITESQPCIDGAFIFPAPDYQDTGDGFVRCTVTAYGRWKTEPKVSRQKRKVELGVYGDISNMPRPVVVTGGPTGPVTVSFSPQNEQPLNKKEVLAEDLVLTFVLPANVDLPLIPLSSLSRLYKLSGELMPQQMDVNYLMGLFGGQLLWKFENSYSSSIITPQEFGSVSVGYDSFAPFDSGISFNLTRCDTVEYGFFQQHTAAFEAVGPSFTAKQLKFRKL